MISDDDFDFTVIAENVFPKDDTNINFMFEVTWKDKSSKLIINCRESSKRGSKNVGVAKIKSFTISEFEAVHKELCTIEEKIEPYFPKAFIFQYIEIERVKDFSSWSIFSRSPASIVEKEKEFSIETVEAIKNYLRAVTEICGQKLLFGVIFKEDNIKYFEDQDVFIKKESKKKIEECEKICKKLLDSHDDFKNLESLSEVLYVKEDEALTHYQDALFDDSLLLSLPLIEESENFKEKLEKSLIDLQVTDCGPKRITELRSEVENLIQQYYEGFRRILHIKISVSKKQKKMFFDYLTKMIEDRSKYSTIIFKDCAGERMSQLSENFHEENEKIYQLKLDEHASKDMVMLRKIELIRSWTESKEMIRPNVRHEDVSLIQLKHLDSSNIEIPVLDEYYAFIKETYKLLLDYTESQMLHLENTKHILDNPIDVILPNSRGFKSHVQTKADEKDSFRSIDYSGLISQECDSDFEDALDEDQFGNLKKTETEKIKLRADYESKLKEIANKRAELRNSKSKLESQYEKLSKKASESSSNSNFESLHLESLHPEKDRMQKGIVMGTSLTAEGRKEEAKKARMRIKKYQEKLRTIPESKGMNSIKPKQRVSGKPGTTSSTQNTRDETPGDDPSPLEVPLPPQGPLLTNIPLAPPPPPINIPPPPPAAPPTIVLKANLPVKLSNKTNMSYIDELQMAFSNRKLAKTSDNIDSEVQARKVKHPSQFANSLSSVVDSRRRFFNSEDDTN